MKKPRQIFTILLSLIASATHAAWQNNGPYGGSVSALVGYKNALYAGTSNSVYRSTDDGVTWMASRTGMPRIRVSSFMVYGPTIFAGTESGIYKSSDGLNWTVLKTGLSNLSITAITSKGTKLFASTSIGIYKSADGGTNWVLANGSMFAQKFAVQGDTIFAATLGSGVQFSVNDGLSWQQVGAIPATFVYTLEQSGNLILAGTSAGVYRSINSGKTWIYSNKGLSPTAYGEAFAIAGNVVLLGSFSEGIYKSNDYGNTWISSNTDLPNYPIDSGLDHNYPTINNLISQNGHFIAATSDGIYTSKNAGASWQQSNNGLRDLPIVSIASGNGRVYCATDQNGIFVSSDAGSTWTRSYNNLSSRNGTAVGVIGSTVFAALETARFYYSFDNGTTWKPILGAIDGNGTAFVSSSGSTVFVSAVSGGKYQKGGVYKLLPTPGGWMATPSLPEVEVLALSVSGNDVYAGAYDGKVYHSEDNGETWSSSSIGLPGSAIKAIRLIGTTLFVGTKSNGVYKSENKGASWLPANSDIGSLHINALSTKALKLYAATNKGVYCSKNKGGSWVALNSDLSNQNIIALEADSVNLYAGTPESIFQMHLSQLTTLAENDDNLFYAKIFPNPASGKFYIETPELESYTITDITGRFVESKTVNQHSILVDLSNELNGIYVIQMKTGAGLITRKLVLQ